MHKFVLSTRDDYIRDVDDAYDRLLLNPDWEARPILAILPDGKGARVLTCNSHDNGTKFHVIHPPRNPRRNNLPAYISDQTCHAVIQSRTIKPMKATQYSTQFQMHEQRGTFAGVDTCSLTNFGRFDSTSLLLAHNESNTIIHRPDINALLTQFSEDGRLTNCVVQSKREEAEFLSRGVDFDAAIRGATYVPVDVTRRFETQLLNNDEFSTAIIDDRENNAPEYTLKFKKVWPVCLYPCQKTDCFGAIFCTLPNMTLRRTHPAGPRGSINIWKIITLLSSIQDLWDVVNTVEFRRSKWHGWLLTYISNTCFPSIHRRSSRKNPYSFQQISSIEKIVNKTGFTNISLTDIFIDFDNVIIANSLELFSNQVDDNTDIIIIDSIQDFDRMLQPNTIVDIDGTSFELRVVFSTWDIDRNNEWDSLVYRRHSGDNFSGWWFQNRKDNLPHQVNHINFHATNKYSFVYVKIPKLDMTSLGTEFLSYIGGQSHVICSQHKLPLIASSERSLLCSCGKREYYRCCKVGCNACACKVCVDNFDSDRIHEIAPTDSNDDD